MTAAVRTTPAAPPPDARDPASLLLARYRDAALGAPAQWNDVLETLMAHRSVRAYRPDPLPDGTLELLIAAAQSASSSSNLQTWSVVAVEDPARKQRLSVFAGDQAFIRQCPLFLVWLADLARLDAIAAERDAALDGLHYLEAMFLGIIDAALAAQNAVVALESLGLGAVYIGAIRNQPDNVARELGLPPHVFPVFGLCVGRPDPKAPASIKPRLGQAAVLHREQYRWEPQRPAIAAYDPVMRTFQDEQGMKAIDWTRLAMNRVKDAAALHGRDRIREVLRTLGFELR